MNSINKWIQLIKLIGYGEWARVMLWNPQHILNYL